MKMTRLVKWFGAAASVVLLATGLGLGSAKADVQSDLDPSEEYMNRSKWFELDPSPDDSYGQESGKKLARASLNIFFSPVEPLKGASQTSQRRGLWTGIIWGGWDGLGRGLIRVLAGTYEGFTFPIPLPEDKAAVDADTLDMTHVFGWTLE